MKVETFTMEKAANWKSVVDVGTCRCNGSMLFCDLLKEEARLIRFSKLMIIASATAVAVVFPVGKAGSASQPPPEYISPSDTAGLSGDPARADSDSVRAGSDPDSFDLSGRSSLLHFPSNLENINTNLVFSVRKQRPANSLMGYEIYRASRMQCTVKGASAGATLGLMAGAFGEMVGAWDDDTSWYIGGAMAAFGALYGGKIKADDDGWSLQIRWDDD